MGMVKPATLTSTLATFNDVTTSPETVSPPRTVVLLIDTLTMWGAASGSLLDGVIAGDGAGLDVGVGVSRIGVAVANVEEGIAVDVTGSTVGAVLTSAARVTVACLAAETADIVVLGIGRIVATCDAAGDET